MKYDLICIGMALVDSIIKGFDPKPVSASGFRAASGTLNVGGKADAALRNREQVLQFMDFNHGEGV